VHYLEACVQSVLNQKTNLQYEIIMIDDGSTDGSSDLSDRLAEEHAVIRVIHQANQGVSVARNTGMDIAEGEYLLFLDADDLWCENLLEQVDMATHGQPDVVQFGYKIVFEDGHTEDCIPPVTINGETGDNYMARILDQEITPVASCWASAHRRMFLKSNGIQFSPGVSYGEDLLFRIQELRRAQRLAGVNAPLYLYRLNEASATSNMSVKKLHDMYSAWAEFFRQYPRPFIAEIYSKQLSYLADLSREEVKVLSPLLILNMGVLRGVRLFKTQISSIVYKLLGFYYGTKVLKFLIDMKNRR